MAVFVEIAFYSNVWYSRTINHVVQWNWWLCNLLRVTTFIELPQKLLSQDIIALFIRSIHIMWFQRIAPSVCKFRNWFSKILYKTFTAFSLNISFVSFFYFSLFLKFSSFRTSQWISNHQNYAPILFFYRNKAIKIFTFQVERTYKKMQRQTRVKHIMLQ